MLNPRGYSILSNAKLNSFVKVPKIVMRAIPQASKENVRLQPMSLPDPPKQWECCGDDCPNCVWNLYFNELREYNRRRENIII